MPTGHDAGTLQQNTEFSNKHDWLTIRNRRLNCRPCSKISTLAIVKMASKGVAKSGLTTK
jgi:hypothetical protein